MFTVSLSGATGGARVGDFPTATVTIEANDSPNGFVSLQSPTIVATENDANTVIMVPVVRRYDISVTNTYLPGVCVCVCFIVVLDCSATSVSSIALLLQLLQLAWITLKY